MQYYYGTVLPMEELNKLKEEAEIELLADKDASPIGFVVRDIGKFNFLKLTIGTRDFYNAEKFLSHHKNVKFMKVSNEREMADATDEISKLISNNEIVNLVRSKLEFGPRALMGTSTLFLPNLENAEANNVQNSRNEVMPTCPVILQRNAEKLFDQNEMNRVIGSNRFMICTLRFLREKNWCYAGVQHKKPLVNEFTGRPQIVTEDYDKFSYQLLDKIEKQTDIRCITNTSFNVHGQPIVFNLSQILTNFEYQMDHCKGKAPYLYVIDDSGLN
jgi:carbamoyltransferase